MQSIKEDNKHIVLAPDHPSKKKPALGSQVIWNSIIIKTCKKQQQQKTQKQITHKAEKSYYGKISMDQPVQTCLTDIYR